MINKKTLTLLLPTLLFTTNITNASIVSINYSGNVGSITGNVSLAPVNIGEPLSGNITIDTTELISMSGDASHKEYIYGGLITYGAIETVNNGTLGSNAAYVVIDNNIVLSSSLVIDDYVIGGFSDDLVWDDDQGRPVSGTQFALRLAFPSSSFDGTDLNFNTLLATPNPIHTEIWMAGYNAFGQTYEVLASLDMNYTISEVPVPAAIWLFGSGLIGLVGLARRKA